MRGTGAVRTGEKTRRRVHPAAVALFQGLLLTALLEGGLRAAKYSDQPVYSPPRLVYVTRNGAFEGEFQLRTGHHYVPEAFDDGRPGIRTAPDYRLGPGHGYPLSGCMRDEHFTPTPESGTERYFLLGESAALGQNPVGMRKPESNRILEPLKGGVTALDRSQTIAAYLQQTLTATGRKAEVINAGMIAQDSGGVRAIAEEVLAYKPTGLLLYIGNNEGIGLALAMHQEPVPAVKTVRGVLRNLRLYRFLADFWIPLIERAAHRNVEQRPATENRAERENSILASMIRAQWATAGEPLWQNGQPVDEVYRALQSRFRGNLEAIVQAANRQGTKVYVLPTPPHLLYQPFEFEHDPSISSHRIAEFTRTANSARKALEVNDLKRATDLSQRAIDLDPAHAIGHYYLGLALARGTDRERGVAELEKALLLDISRKRSIPAYARVAAEVCTELGCTAGDTYGALVARLRKEGLGVYDELFGDHEHLEPAGNAWIASQFAQLILAPPATPSPTGSQPVAAQIHP